jgi:hypothetical protein
MSKREGDTVTLEPTAPEKCELCGLEAECRPYGKNGESVCFDCGMLDEDTARERLAAMLFGDVN